MTELMAIDVLLLPDESARERARELNALLREDLGHGFAFDQTHHPHITLLQRYVHDEDLEAVLEAVATIEEAIDVGAVRLPADGLTMGSLGTPPGVVMASVVFAPRPEVLRLHEAALTAVAPLGEEGGSPEAFFALPGEPPANPATVAYVEGFVPEHSGSQYEPHMSLGLAREQFVKRLRDDPALQFEFRPAALAVCRLGDHGTAREVLRSWPVGV